MVLVGQITQQAQRRLAAVLRQLGELSDAASRSLDGLQESASRRISAMSDSTTKTIADLSSSAARMHADAARKIDEIKSGTTQSLDSSVQALGTASSAATSRIAEMGSSADDFRQDSIRRISSMFSSPPRQQQARKPTLRLEVHCAKNLQNTQTFGAQDPYVVASLGNPTAAEQWQSHRTLAIESGGTNPIWSGAHNNAMDFVFGAGTPAELSIQLWNENIIEGRPVPACVRARQAPLFAC